MIKEIPRWSYEDPSLKLEITSLVALGDLLNVNVYKGDSLATMTPLSAGSARLGDKFSIGTDETYIITVYPNDHTISGDFEFKYYIEGVEYSTLWKLYYQTIKDREFGDEYEIIALVMAGIFVCIIFGGLAYFIRTCCCEKGRIDIDDLET